MPAETQGMDMAPRYFSVSCRKMAMMSLFSFGLYEIYWFYRNWRYVRAYEGSGIKPLVRAIFSLLFCYSLLKRINRDLYRVNADWGFSVIGITVGWTFLTLVANVPNILSFIGCFSGFVLLPVQKRINLMNKQNQTTVDSNDKITAKNIVVVLAGIALMIVIQIYTP